MTVNERGFEITVGKVEKVEKGGNQHFFFSFLTKFSSLLTLSQTSPGFYVSAV